MLKEMRPPGRRSGQLPGQPVERHPEPATRGGGTPGTPPTTWLSHKTCQAGRIRTVTGGEKR